LKPEARLWASVRTHLKRDLDRIDRVENAVADGQPDVNGCIQGEDVWIELKAPSEPKRATTALMANNHKLLQSQVNWFARQRQAGGIAFILLRTETLLLLVDGTKHADNFNSMTVAKMKASSLFATTVPTPQQQWSLLRNVIFTASRYRRLHQHASAQLMLDELERRKEGMADHRYKK